MLLASRSFPLKQEGSPVADVVCPAHETFAVLATLACIVLAPAFIGRSCVPMPIAAASTTTPHANSMRAPRRAISLPKRLAIHHCPRSSLLLHCIPARLRYVLYLNDCTSWRTYPSRPVGLSSGVAPRAILMTLDAPIAEPTPTCLVPSPCEGVDAGRRPGLGEGAAPRRLSSRLRSATMGFADLRKEYMQRGLDESD